MRKYIDIIYEKLKAIIKENYKYLIFLSLFAIFCFYDTGYSIYKPGGIINSSIRVTGDNLSTSKGSFNMAYVNMMKGRLPFYLVAKLNPNWELIKDEKLSYSDSETIDDVLVRDGLQYDEAMSNAMYVAFTKSGVDFKVIDSKFYVSFIAPKNDSDLKIGDIIISYDDIKIKSFAEFKKYVSAKKDQDKIKITYLHNKKELTTYTTVYSEDNNSYVGLSLTNIININSNYNLKVKTKGSESGPSGGLITTLAIYDALVDEDLTKGRKIVGTGTINLDGTVGEIGSIDYKLAAAVKNKADIFLCPTGNYEEAINYAKTKKYDIIIKDVSSFEDAVNYLNSLK